MTLQGLSGLLEQLGQLAKGSQNDDEASYQLVEDLAETCLHGVTAENTDIVISSLFGEKNGILDIIKASSSNAALRRSTTALLDCLAGVIKKYGKNIRNSADKIKDTCITVYRKTSIAALKVTALQTFSEVLQSYVLAPQCTELDKTAKTFLVPELAKADTQVKATVKYEILVLLGLICKTAPSSMQPHSESLADKIIGMLNHQMTRQKSSDSSIISGCFKSLYYFLSSFDRSAKPEQNDIIFKSLAKALDPKIKTSRYDIPKAALDLLAKHGEQFRSQLLRSYKDMYDRLVAFSAMHNDQVKKSTFPAIENFLRQIGSELVDPIDEALPDEKRKEIFYFFLKDFMAHMKSISSSIRSVSQAIRSYGYFAAAIREFQGENEVREMLTILLEKCFQVYTSSEETTDNKLTFLPSFIQSLASIIKHTHTVDEGVSEPLRVIFSLAMEFYPKLTGPVQKSCASAIIQFLYTVCGMKNRPSHLLSDLVYQGLLQTCIHPPLIEGDQPTLVPDEGNKAVSYQDYTQLWIDILSPRKYTGAISMDGLSALETCMYGEFITALLKMCNKLNLAFTPDDEEDQNTEISAAADNSAQQSAIGDTVSQASGTPVMVKDFQIVINIADVMKSVLADTKTDLFHEWTFTYCHTIIKLSTQYPRVSSFYKLLTSAMGICSANGYFDSVIKPSGAGDGEEDMDILSDNRGVACDKTHQLITKHQKKVVTCMRQYKDDLLISCLKFLFSLPVSIITQQLPSMSEALQVGLSLGLSYPPLISQCLNTLKLLFASLPEDEKLSQLTVLLPYLDKFLQATDKSEEKDETTRKVLKNKQRLKLPPALLRLADVKTSSGRSDMQKLKLEVLKFLGELGGQDNQHVVRTDRRDISQIAVSWSTTEHIKFSVPFKDAKPDIYLDKFLPRACELALSSGNRQTKVAACELVHSLVLLLLGCIATQPENMRKPADHVFKKLFPVLLKLSVDIELVSQQLFEPLMYQLIHWFTGKPKLKETGILLDTLMEGVESVNNSALREFSAKCVAEYLKWSIKQISVKQLQKNSECVKPLLRQMSSMARHPSYSKRLGACLVYNHIYTILREEKSLVDKYTMETLVCFIDCLALAHSDEQSLGTHTEARKCLKHIERIFKAKKDMFLTRSVDRRTPMGWPPNATLKDAVIWLLGQIARPETECRHACIELISNLSSSLPAEMNSNPKLITYITGKEGIQYLRDICDGVYKIQDGHKSVSMLTNPFTSRREAVMSVKAGVQWFHRVLASLDAYCWLIGNSLIAAPKLLSGSAPIFDVIEHFINDISTKSLPDLTTDPLVVYTPSEIEEFNRAKCTMTVRLFDFLSILIHAGKEVLLEGGALNSTLWSLFGSCIVDPELVGFNMADIEIITNLPGILGGMIQALKRVPLYLSQFKTSMKDLLSQSSYKMSDILSTFDTNLAEEQQLRYKYVTSGYQLLCDAGVLNDSLPTGLSASELSLQLTQVVIKASTAVGQRSRDPTTSRLLESFYSLALSMDVNSATVVEMLYSDKSDTVYAHTQQVILKYMVSKGEPMVKAVMSHAAQSPNKTSSYLIGLLDHIRTATSAADLPDREKTNLLKVADCVLDNWSYLSAWWRSKPFSSSNLTFCIFILKKSLLLSGNLEKKKCFGELVEFFTQTLLSPNTEHTQICDLLDILPAFLSGSEGHTEKIRSGVQSYVNMKFPLKSDELPVNSTGFHEYINAFRKILEAMVIGSDLDILKIMLTVICREELHVQEDMVQDYIRRFANRIRKLNPDRQIEAQKICFNMYRDSANINQTSRISALDRVLIPILHRADKVTKIEFFKLYLLDIKKCLIARESKMSPDTWQTQIRDRASCFKLVEFLYSSLLKDEVFNAASYLAKLWVSDDQTASSKADAWKNLTKDLIRICKDCAKEDMRGETVHLELRRRMHCAAYNALIAIISNTQTDIKFYQQFIFSGDAAKGQSPLENICPQDPYVFETELSALPVRKKKLVSMRQAVDDSEESTADTVIYMQTVNESSLTEDLSKYDFSYSQSLASSRQRNEEKEKQQLELLYPESNSVESSSAKISQGFVELESDALNEHECMAAFTALLQHMVRHEITPSNTNTDDSLPQWIVWLRDKLETGTTPINVKHFIARLIINNEKVFSPFAAHLLPAFVKYTTQCYDELHYFAMDMIVLILTWSSTTKPEKDAVGQAMLNSLVEFIMRKAHHERKGIFKNNLELLKTCLERWRSFICVNTSVIVDLLKNTSDTARGSHIVSAIQLLGVIVVNKIDPYNATSCHVSKIQFYAELAKCMMHRLLSIYSSSAEVVGLVFNLLLNGDDNSKAFLQQYEQFVEKGLSKPDTKVHKFIVCVHGIQLHYPPFCDRFMSKVLFEIRRLHGDMKVKGLEIISSRIGNAESPFKQLCDINFTDLLSHRNSQVMVSCLKSIINIVDVLKPDQLWTWLPLVADCLSNGSASCRQMAHSIFMRVYNKYKSESENGSVIEKLVTCSKENLLLGLADHHQPNRLLVQNFWSADSTLSENITTRLTGILTHMYSPSTEPEFLSYATNLIFELTSKSTDFDREIFGTPLSDCKFEAYAVNATWTQRFSTLAPMFADGGSQSLAGTGGSLGLGMLRETQATQQFTATQGQPGGRAQKAYDWMTNSTMDASLDATATLGESSSLLFQVGTSTKKKPVSRPSPSTSRNTGQDRDQVDSRINAPSETNSELSALRRRFIKDQESSRVFFAKKEMRRKKMEEGQKAASRKQRENQVTLYRQYRIGDLPDIQIKHSAVIAPLQALAQKDDATARMLFLVMFRAILSNSDDDQSEETKINIMHTVEKILRESEQHHPSFVACLLELVGDLAPKLEFPDAVVSNTGIQAKQQSIACLALEQKVQGHDSESQEPKSKRRRTSVKQVQPDENVGAWTELARLYKSTESYDLVHSIMSNKIGAHDFTKQAIELESKSHYQEAVDLYEKILCEEELSEMFELTLIDDSRLDCMYKLTSWSDMKSTILANLDDNFSNVWQNDVKDFYLGGIMKCGVRNLMSGSSDSTDFIKFIDESCRESEQRKILEINYSEELAIIQMANKEFERASHYHRLCTDRLLYEWSTLDELMSDARVHNLQSLQKLREMGEFLSLVRKTNSDAEDAESLVNRWIKRSPGHLSSTSTWDDIITNRCFYTHMMDSMDGLGTNMVQSRVDMRINQAKHAASHDNVDLSKTLLRAVYKDIQENELGMDASLNWSAAGVQIKLKSANIPDITLLSKIHHTSAALRSMDKYSNAQVDGVISTTASLSMYDWYSLKSSLWSCLFFSVLESSDIERDECLENLCRITGCEEINPAMSHISKQALTNIQKSMTTDQTSHKAQAHMDMVLFSDQRLRYAEENEGGLLSLGSEDEMAKNLIISCTKALNLGSDSALSWIPRLLQVIELYPSTISTFVKETGEVPSWMFITWVSQMMALLDTNHCTAIHHIIQSISTDYPMAIVYPFMISHEGYTYGSAGDSETVARQFVDRLKSTLSKLTLVDTFVQALEQLSQPEAFFGDWVNDTNEKLKQKKPDYKEIERSYMEVMKQMFGQKEETDEMSLYDQHAYIDHNEYKKRFTKVYKEKVEKAFGVKGKEISKLGKKFSQHANQLRGDMRDRTDILKGELAPPGLLKDYSRWLARFPGDLTDYKLEVPGQYGNSKRKPIPEYHVNIAGFDEKVMVLRSIRKPKRLIIRGDDEREYKFLVKGGEDLRQDQRIETIFSNMNQMISNSRKCQRLSLVTYNVIPLNTRLGLIEWIDDISTLKELITKEQTTTESRQIGRASREWDSKYPDNTAYLKGYSSFTAEKCSKWFSDMQAAIEADPLRRVVHKMSRSVEAYYMIREEFVSSYAVMCVCHYILGIGDRHLSNVVLDTQSGRMVGIDFGHAFGSNVSILPIPELVPFRLTGQLLTVMQPYGTTGLFDQTMINVLTVMRENRRQLLNLLDIFIKEPSVDWMINSRRQAQKADIVDDSLSSSNPSQSASTGTSVGSTGSQADTAAEWYPREKVMFAKLKLLGAHPRYITAEEFKLNPSAKQTMRQGLSYIAGSHDINKNLRLSVDQQVKELIDQATDPNLLGRIFKGWEPFV